MLSGIERKVLRIIGNYQVGRHLMPPVDELCIKTGCSRSGIAQVLNVLGVSSISS
ncbi:hypothetical protein ACFYU8_17320 [Brevibacillus sp. NPDC003359]|uniref:hypothetical protein n=1 Tax=unclassified Brevibacillus TaxID=2684853 RepID=UPI0036CD840F